MSCSSTWNCLQQGVNAVDEALFLLALKSTLDKVMLDLRAELLPAYPTLLAVEVDDMAETDVAQKSDAPALIWSFGTLAPAPRAPMYRVEFMVGAKTTADSGNYILTALLTKVRQKFTSDTTLTLLDLSGPVAGTNPVGFLHVASNEIAPQEHDRQSGLRYALVRGSAVAYG